MIAQSRPGVGAVSTSRGSSCSRRSIACFARAQNDAPASQCCVSALLSAAMATSLMLSAPAAMAAPERKSFGAERTFKLIEEAGTPEAARPDTMKTNVPFQAPGINKSPRGAGQERGTSPKEVVRNVKKQIKENNSDPDSTPLGISKGPLVRQAKKMKQPGDVTNLNKAGTSRFKRMATDTQAAKAVEKDPSRPEKRGIINGSFTTLFGGRNQ